MSTAEYLQLEARVNSNRRVKIALAPPDAEPIERDLHSKIHAECRRRGWICLTGSMAHRAMRTIGEPDFTILADKGRVFFVEAKSKTGKLRPEQAALQAWANKLGHRVEVIRSMEEFMKLVNASIPPASPCSELV